MERSVWRSARTRAPSTGKELLAMKLVHSRCSPEENKVPGVARAHLCGEQKCERDHGKPSDDDQRRHRASGYLGFLLWRVVAHLSSRERAHAVVGQSIKGSSVAPMLRSSWRSRQQQSI